MNKILADVRRRVSSLRFLASLALLTCLSSTAPAQTPTHKSIPLDCGGWFSGLDISSGGRLFGYGDVFGVWRSDAGQEGRSWRYLQGDFTINDNTIVGLSAAATNADIVVFATSKNVYRSTNGGFNWSLILTGITGPGSLDRGSSAVKIHPTASDEIWLARARTGFTGLLWRSNNGGTSWEKIGGPTFDSIRPLSVYIHPQFPAQIWVGARGGFYVSTNSGSTWTLVWNNNGQNNPAFPNDPAIVKSLVRRTDGTGYFAANIGGFRVTASNWADASTYVCTQTVNRVGGQGPVSAAVMANGNFLTTSNESYVKRSTDGGQNWSDLASTLVTPPTPAWTIPATSNTKAAAGRDMILADPTNQSRWFMTGGKSPVITTDSGATWKYPPALNDLAGVPTYRVQFPRNNANLVLIAGADQGVFTLDDGGASREADSSTRASLDVHQAYHDVLSSDDGQTLVAAGVNQSTNENLIMRSTNAGITWAAVTFSGLPTNFQGITRAVAAPGNVSDFLVLLGFEAGNSRNNPGLYRTINGGANFAKVTGIPDGVNTGNRYHHENSWLIADGVNTNTRYLTLRSANNVNARGFYRSTNGGSDWSKLSVLPFGTDWIHGMCADPVTAGRVWVAGDYLGLKRSDNGGDSWTSVGSFTKALRVSAHNGRLAVWGRRSGDTWDKVYYSLDNGANWSEKTGAGNRYAFLSDLTVDPYRIGQIWIAGLSVNVIDTLTAPAAPNTTINRATGGTASASGENLPNEGVAKAFDGSASTKWLTNATTGWIGYAFGGGTSRTVTSYALTSANDVPTRDPRNWQLQGSNDGTNWTTLATETGQTFGSRFQRRVFTVSSPGNYNRYRLNITQNNGEIFRTQLAELQLY